LRKAKDYEGEIVMRYVEAREMSILAGDAFGNAPGMLFVLVEDFVGAFSSSGKCSVMLVAGPRCGGGPRSN
jgi:hypothetical protein